MKKRMEENGEYGKAMNRVVGGGTIDLSHVTKRSIENQFYSDLVTQLPEHIDPAGTDIHIFYALKMGKKYRKRYETHFTRPIVHEHDLRHEELLLMYPGQWLSLINEICLSK